MRGMQLCCTHINVCSSCFPGGCTGGVWLEIGPWRCFQTTQKGNAVVCFPWLWNPDLHYDLRHSLYVFTVLMIVSRTTKAIIDKRASSQTMWNPKEIPTTNKVVEHCSKNQRIGV